MNSIRFYERAVARLTRREALKIVGILGAGALVPSIAPLKAFGKQIFKSYPFRCGVASGDPLPRAVVLWTRLAPEPLDGGGMPPNNVDVTWEVAEDDRFTTLVRKGTVIARPEFAHNVHVDVEGLRPGREYWYRFRVGDELSQTGRTKTAPAPGLPVSELRFGVCGCSNYENGYFTGYRYMTEERFDFVVHTGDYIYELAAGAGVSQNRIRPHLGPELRTLSDYRNRYAQYRTDPDSIALHATSPFIVTWDDHEVVNDYAGANDKRGTPPEIFLLRRAAAYQAYFESMPLRRTALPSGSSMRLYRRFTFGRLLDLSMLDTRQYRSVPGCGGDFAVDCPAATETSRTILGAAQEKWLYGNLATMKSTWTVIGQQVPTYAREESGRRHEMDKWDGYVASRTGLYERLKATRAPNPVILSGDVHVHYGSDLKMNFLDPASETVGVEFTNSSLTSNGDGADFGGSWDQVRELNPHIKYHSGRRGYISCSATPAAMRADFKVLDFVTKPDSPVRTGGSLLVEAGHPGLIKG